MHARPRVLVLTAVLTLLLCGMLASVAMAAPGGKKATGATLSVSGDVSAASVGLASYGPLNVTGTGYEPRAGVTIVMTSPTAISFFGGLADGEGNISITNTTNSDGAYKLEAYQYQGTGQKSTMMASISFFVNP